MDEQNEGPENTTLTREEFIERAELMLVGLSDPDDELGMLAVNYEQACEMLSPHDEKLASMWRSVGEQLVGIREYLHMRLDK